MESAQQNLLAEREELLRRRNDLEASLQQDQARLSAQQEVAAQLEAALQRGRQLESLAQESHKRQAELETLKTTLESEKAALLEELSQWKRKALEEMPRDILALQKHLDAADENLRRISQELERESNQRQELVDKEKRLEDYYRKKAAVIEADLRQREEALAERQTNLQNLEDRLAQEYAQKQSELEELKTSFQRDMTKLIERYREPT